ncbi:sugar phosphate isomerase/epimerase family protein [Cohnella herbarum]|uniref:Sugar phosphate isomerase/epimerase n=1 Tax=Cohnella herbarum TaxID=2728023 RepID=A0A7Z2VJR7_9BACL|nr:sugar phosphate isomerase/epimerase family protein [Cohnella herbarum]QJD84478.1 sugar phosphate isomerase/epimerase [Cohnella herbarum]
MKLGISSYSLWQAVQSGELDFVGVVGRVAELGGEHVEIVPLGFDLTNDPAMVEAIKSKAAEAGIEISNYAIGANFAGLNDEAFALEIERVKREVDVAAALGAKLMRHDVANSKDTSIRQFMADFPKLVEACRTIADYASQYGITTSIENHGYYVQASDRVHAIVNEVDRENFRTTLDIGNFVCVDENPVVGVRNNVKIASIVHVKDFYIRPETVNPGDGWFRSANGAYLRGAIAGQGDLDTRASLRAVKESGFDGYLSIEFEGMEPCIQATKIALDNVRRIWEEI